MRILFSENEYLSAHSTFKIGGPARFFAEISSFDILEAVDFARGKSLPLLVIGNGSNLLFSDKGFDGVVIKLEPGVAVSHENVLSASGGTTLAACAKNAADASQTGMEFAHSIPGTVGGAIYMNAGAYDGQVSDILTSCTVLDCSLSSPEVLEMPADDLSFGYRDSIFKRRCDWIILSAQFELAPGNRDEIEEKMRRFAQARREKQPLNLPSAGSVFKRPEGHFAGKLIEDCGLKGFQIGGAQVSEKHAGFIVNRGGATCADVLALIEHIEQTVFSRFGVALEREIKLVGQP